MSIDERCYEVELAQVVERIWGKENGIKYLAGFVRTLLTDKQIRVLIEQVVEQQRGDR